MDIKSKKINAKGRKILMAVMLFLIIAMQGYSQQPTKVKIEKIEQLPVHTYPVKDSLVALLKNEQAIHSLQATLKNDLLNDMNTFDIDANLLKSYYKMLGALSFYESDYSKSLLYYDTLKSIETKPGAKLTNALIKRAQIKAKTSGSADYNGQFLKAFTESVNALNYANTSSYLDDIRSQYKNNYASSILAGASSEIDPFITAGPLSLDDAEYVLWLFYELPVFDQNRAIITRVLDSTLAANNEKINKTISTNDVVLPAGKKYTSVVISVFDLGTDISLFPNQLYTNTKEKPDSIDNDNNGFIDDIHGVAFDMLENKTASLLMPLSKQQQKDLPKMMSFFKGFGDSDAGLNTKESKVFNQQMDSAKGEEKQKLWQQIQFIGDYAHGTHVAGIALKGNPYAKLLTVRFSDDVGFTEEANPPSEATEKKVAQNLLALVDYWKAAHVRVVTMSWGYFLSDYETEVQKHYKELTEEEKKKLALQLWTMRKNALYNAFSSAPDILFIASCGNKNNNSDNDLRYPAALDLPNVMGIGSVNREGKETPFTATGSKVVVHANGYQVESYAPGGLKLLMSGTSMATPNVANLAAKLFTLKPTLTVSQVVALIKDGADTFTDSKVKPINPARSIELLKQRYK